MGEPPIRSADGAVVRLVGALLDITERKQTEDNLARLNRTLQTLYQCNQALVHAADEQELLQSVCRILVETGGLRMAWVGYRELNADKTVRPVTQAGYERRLFGKRQRYLGGYRKRSGSHWYGYPDRQTLLDKELPN